MVEQRRAQFGARMKSPSSSATPGRFLGRAFFVRLTLTPGAI